MKAICYVLIKREGPKLRKVTQSLERVTARSDEGLLENIRSIGWQSPSLGRQGLDTVQLACCER